MAGFERAPRTRSELVSHSLIRRGRSRGSHDNKSGAGLLTQETRLPPGQRGKERRSSPGAPISRRAMATVAIWRPRRRRMEP